MSEVFPTVSVDLEVGKYVDDIDIDYDTLVDYMKNKSCDEQMIGDTVIHIMAKEAVEKLDKNQVAVTRGRYYEDDRSIALFPVYAIRKAQINLEYSLGEGTADKDISTEYSGVLAHELEHRIIHGEGGMPEANRHYRKNKIRLFGGFAVPCVLGNAGFVEIMDATNTNPSGSATLAAGVGIALGSYAFMTKAVDSRKKRHALYLADPEEVRCRHAEAHSPDNLIHIAIKPPTIQPENT